MGESIVTRDSNKPLLFGTLPSLSLIGRFLITSCPCGGLSEETLLEDFEKLRSRVSTMQTRLAAEEQREVRLQMEEFLEYAEEQLQEVKKEIEELGSWKRSLAEFLCEDEDAFRLEECCRIFSCFCQKFQMAMKENRIRDVEEARRQQWERKRLQKRHSMATCGALEVHQAADELELTLERNLQNLCRPPSVRLCRVRSFGSHGPNPFVPQSEQRERIQACCERRNAEHMRQTSERVLRQQMEHRSSRTPSKGSVYPKSTIMGPLNCQEDKGPSDTPELEPPVTPLTPPVHRADQNIVHMTDRHRDRPALLDEASAAPTCPAPRVTDTEADTQADRTQQARSLDLEGLHISGHSKPSVEAAKTRPPTDHMRPVSQEGPVDGPLTSRQPIHTMRDQSTGQHNASSQLLSHGPLTCGPRATRQGPQCTCVAITEEPMNDFVVQCGPEPQGAQPRTQSRIPLHPSRSEPSHVTQTSTKPLPEGGKKSTGQALYQPLTWDKQKDSTTPQKSPEQPTGDHVLDLEARAVSAPGTSTPTDHQIVSETPNPLKTRQGPSGLGAAVPSRPGSEALPRPVRGSEDQQSSPGSTRAFSQHTPDTKPWTMPTAVSSSSTETLTPDEAETGPPTRAHPEGPRGDDPPAHSALRPPRQSTAKSLKQTLLKPPPKNSRQSTVPPGPPTPGPSSGHVRSEPCNPPSKTELRRNPQSKAACFMTRIKHVEHLSIKVPPRPQNDRQPNEEDNLHATGPPHPREPPPQEALNHCSKWKRELRKASNPTAAKVEHGGVDNATTPTPRRSSISKRGKQELSMKRTVSTGPGESKLPQKVSATGKSPATKEKRDNLRTHSGDPTKHSPTMTSRPLGAPPEGPGHGAERGKEQAWPSKKTNPVARVAIHVIKHYEVNSTLTRGSRGPCLTTHPVWR